MASFHYEAAISHIQSNTWWQWKIHLSLFFCVIGAGIGVVVYAFTGFVPNYRCRIPQCEMQQNATYYGNENFFDKFVVVSMPKSTLESSYTCSYYNIPQLPSNTSCVDFISAIVNKTASLTYFNLTISHCQHKDLVFDTSVVLNSIVTEYEFTCDSHVLSAIMSPLYMLGMLLGSFTFGWISDSCGRVKSLMLAIFCLSIGGIIGAFSQHAWFYGILRVMCGMGGIGIAMASFLLGIEFASLKYRTIIGILLSIGFPIGEIIFGIEAYFIRDWRILTLTAHIPILLSFSFYLMISESPRWLLSKGRNQEAKTTLLNIFSSVGIEIPEEAFEAIDDNLKESSDQQFLGFKHLFVPCVMFQRLSILFLQWFSITMTFYGLIFASNTLSPNAHRNFILTAIIEIPAILCCILIMKYLGRRSFLSISQFICGISCFGAAFLVATESQHEIFIIILTLIGKFCSTISFTIVYIFTSELFPTGIRNRALGCCSSVARIGAIFAIVLNVVLHDYWPSGTMLCMGILTVLASLIALALPETFHANLPETLNDAINLGCKSK